MDDATAHGTPIRRSLRRVAGGCRGSACSASTTLAASLLDNYFGRSNPSEIVGTCSAGLLRQQSGVFDAGAGGFERGQPWGVVYVKLCKIQFMAEVVVERVSGSRLQLKSLLLCQLS